MSLQIMTIAISGLSLVISGLVAWLTLLRRGKLKMTQPTMVFFGSDSPHGPQKVVLRTLLYSTARRGHIVENMFVRLRYNETTQKFDYWAYGEKTSVRGSGLRVGYEGVAYYHHFLLHEDVTNWKFADGNYVVEVFATLVNFSKPLLLSRLNLTVSNKVSNIAIKENMGIFFDWEPDSKQYHSHINIHSATGF
jgi:hypothetical protein